MDNTNNTSTPTPSARPSTTYKHVEEIVRAIRQLSPPMRRLLLSILEEMK